MGRWFALTLLLAVSPALIFAQGAGMMGGMAGMAGGGGMLVVADDGSLLVTEMGLGGMMGGGPGSGSMLERELINIGPDGVERWRTSFDDGWPMMPATDGDLVVLTLVDDWWTGIGGWGDGGWWFSGDGPGDGGMPTGGVTLVGLDLASGAELWRAELDGGMGAMPQFAPDGSRFYVSLREMGFDGGFDGPMHQGDGFGAFITTTVVALDRSGTVVWSIELDDGHMGGGKAAGGLQ